MPSLIMFCMLRSALCSEGRLTRAMYSHSLEKNQRSRSVIHKLLFFILSLSRFQVRPCTYPQIGL
jgi:hypothetical protein